MSTVIRHVCGGHEYRYDIKTGVVTNNYDTEIAILGFCKFTGFALLYANPGDYQGIRRPTTPDHLIASRRGLSMDDVHEQAVFAISHVASNAVSEL